MHSLFIAHLVLYIRIILFIIIKQAAHRLPFILVLSNALIYRFALCLARRNNCLLISSEFGYCCFIS